VVLAEGVREHHPSGQSSVCHPADLDCELESWALRLGFVRAARAPLRRYGPETEELEEFLAQERQGEMSYLGQRTDEGELVRSDPRHLMASAQSAVVVALPYAPLGCVALRASRVGAALGRTANYAGGRDYHAVIKERLLLLADRIADLKGGPVLARACVDTAPLLERQLARDAGFAFLGKHTLAIIPGVGSAFHLGVLLLDLPPTPSGKLASRPLTRGVNPEKGDATDARVASRSRSWPSERMGKKRLSLNSIGERSSVGCGTCQSCRDACPTGALDDDFRIDARRCISYLTIEHRGIVPRSLRSKMGTWVFGCDVCQSVCPYSATKGAPSPDPELVQSNFWGAPSLQELLTFSSSAYKKHVRGTAIRRVDRAQLVRNAAIALGNAGALEATEALGRIAREFPSLPARVHATWALGRFWVDHSHEAAGAALLALALDPESEVRREAELALKAATDSGPRARGEQEAEPVR
jgi:epoxyqueuosine reductase